MQTVLDSDDYQWLVDVTGLNIVAPNGSRWPVITVDQDCTRVEFYHVDHYRAIPQVWEEIEGVWTRIQPGCKLRRKTKRECL